jgi:hypothetical protein
MLLGRYNSGIPLLIKFDDNKQYWYWDRNNQNWILGTTLFEEYWLNGHLTPVVEEAGKRMVEEEAEILI